MAPLGGGAMKMATRQWSTEVTGGASMERWFRARAGEIGVTIDAVDNGGGVIMPFIGS
jgi:hypothetical protein